MSDAPAPAQNRDVVVIGASAGGVEAVQIVLNALPADLPAAVFVVLHMPMGFQSRLPEVLNRHGPLHATHALHGERIETSRVYVAPPDNHILVRPGYVHVVRGPKENGHRPAVDALFRTASTVYGPRVIGVVLTGALDCGTAGLLSIKARGGVAVVQDPTTAEVADMPSSAVRHVDVDHVVHLADVAATIDRLVREPAPLQPVKPVPTRIQELEGDETARAADLVCPICQGKLVEAEVGEFSLFRCHVGHAFSLETLLAEQAEEVERALWGALRALEEAAALSGRLASSASGRLQTSFEEKQRVQEDQAEVLRRLLLDPRGLNRTDAFAVGAEPLPPSNDG